MTVSLVVVSHSGKIAEGAAELAAQMAPDVLILAAGGTSEGRIGTSLEKVLAALDRTSGGDGAVVLTDLGSAVMTAESAIEFAENPNEVVLADAPLVEGLVAAAVAAQAGADLQAVKLAAEAAAGPVPVPAEAAAEAGGAATARVPDSEGEFELVNQAGMHARPAAKIAGGLSSMDADVLVNGTDATSMTALMTLAAGKGSMIRVEAWGTDAQRAVDYVGGLVREGFGEP